MQFKAIIFDMDGTIVNTRDKNALEFVTGFEQFHAMITKHNLKSAIATNADEATFEKTKQALQLQRFFGPHMYSIACVGNVCKPQPAIYLHAAAQLGCKPEECIAIEDSYTGILAAQRAGMKCIGINTNKNKAALGLAHHIIDDYTKLTADILNDIHQQK